MRRMLRLRRGAARAASPLLLVAFQAALGCGAAPPASHAPHGSSEPGTPATSPAAAPGAAPTQAIAAAPPCRDASPPDAPGDLRARGIDAFLSGRPREAAALLAEALRARPGDAAAEVFRAASEAKLSVANDRAADEAASAPVVRLDPIPLARSSGAAPPSDNKVRLDKVSEARNLITDDADWLQQNGLTPRALRGRAHLPEHVGRAFRGARLQALFRSPDHDVASYGTWLVASAPGKRPRVFDAAQAMQSGPLAFEVGFAALVGGVLVVQLAYNGYAANSGGKNGYVAAFDAASGRRRWSTDPLVSNSVNFHVAGGSLVTGYGFTAEPDFLFVLDVATGAVDQKIRLGSGPSEILAKGDRLFVRTYDTDYVFRVAGEPARALPPAPAAKLAPAPPDAPGRPVDAEVRCQMRAAVAAIDRKDAAALGEATQALAPLSADRALFDALERTRATLAKRDERRLDLSGAPPIVIPPPPWQYALFSAGPAPLGKPPRLIKGAATEADPVRALRKEPFRREKPFFLAPVARGALPPGAPREIPSSYGMEDLRAIIPSGDLTLLIYGGRYLVLVSGAVVERVFDLDALRHPPDPNPQWKEFAVEDATYAQVQGDAVYVCNGGGSYAREVKGKKGFLTALVRSTGRMRWRSDPLVCNATFVLVGDYMVSGYGFTDEPDFVFLVRLSDGKVVQRVPIDTGPHSITWEGPRQGGRVLVEAYANRYLFELRAQ